MIDLNILPLTAPNIASPIATFQAPAASTNSSATTAQDFSAILTEMVGFGPTLPLSSAPSLTAAPVDSTNSLAPSTPGITIQQPQLIGPTAAPTSSCNKGANDVKVQETTKPEEPTKLEELTKAGETAKPQEAAPEPADGQLLQGQTISKPQEPQESKNPRKTTDTQNQLNPVLFVMVAPVLVAHSVQIEQKPLVTHEVGTQQPQINADPAVASIQGSTLAVQAPEIQRAWADVKKFEFTVQKEAAQPDGMRIQPQVAPADVQKQAIVTTDPIANIQLQQLPPRITAIEKLLPDTKLPDRAKPETSRVPVDTTTPGTGMHFADITRSTEQVEQARPAHQVVIPEIPHLPVVRTVAMEVGDADSQVTVRIQERAGDISLQINAANEPLHQDLQSSVGSLVQALKQEQVQVSNVEVSRKSPIDKVRRMKEAN